MRGFARCRFPFLRVGFGPEASRRLAALARGQLFKGLSIRKAVLHRSTRGFIFSFFLFFVRRLAGFGPRHRQVALSWGQFFVAPIQFRA